MFVSSTSPSAGFLSKILDCRNRQKAITSFLSALATARTSASHLEIDLASLEAPSDFTAAALQTVLASVSRVLSAAEGLAAKQDDQLNGEPLDFTAISHSSASFFLATESRLPPLPLVEHLELEVSFQDFIRDSNHIRSGSSKGVQLIRSSLRTATKGSIFSENSLYSILGRMVWATSCKSRCSASAVAVTVLSVAQSNRL